MRASKPVRYLILLLAVLVTSVAFARRSGFKFGLCAQSLITSSETGIPGIDEWHEARLVNHGFWPVSVTECDAIDDAGCHETFVAYAVERWNSQAGTWQQVVVFDESNFCKPYPLGIVTAQLQTRSLWPGQSVSTGEEITAARLHKGDKARFVVFVGRAGDYSHAVATSPFEIDEGMTEPDVPYRVRH